MVLLGTEAQRGGTVPPLIQPNLDEKVAALVGPAEHASVAEAVTSATILQTTRGDHCPNRLDETPTPDRDRSRTRTATILHCELLPETTPNLAD